MNEKFFDLKKEKQDRMIGAAQKAFGLNGYDHASTDDIVRDASISKGLLFHYFGSKKGLYTFLFDYSVRIFLLEIDDKVDRNETDYFDLYRQILAARAATMQQYPYLQTFLLRAEKETVEGTREEMEEQKTSLRKSIQGILKRGDVFDFVDGVDYERILAMLDTTMESLLLTGPGETPISADEFARESEKYVRELEKILKR